MHAIHDALGNDEAVIIFPSGEVSRAGPRGIRDGRWQAGFMRFAEQAKAPVLPVHLDGRNSALFYSLSTIFKPLSTLMLVGEAMRQRDATLPVRIGEIIPWREIAALDLPREQKIRRITGQLYGLPKNKVVPFRTEKPIAHPEPRLDVRRELRDGTRLGRTNDGKDIFLLEGRCDSAVMRELGRLREIAFRQVGEGTGKRRDLDAFDAWYKHVVLWDESDLEIVGAYRIGEAGAIVAGRGVAGLYTHGLFTLEEGFFPYLAESIELGRSFVQPRYQGLRALDYLWYGIGAYLASRPDIRYLFGPVSISADYPEEARSLIVHFYRRYFGVEERLATPRVAIRDSRVRRCLARRGDIRRGLRARLPCPQGSPGRARRERAHPVQAVHGSLRARRRPVPRLRRGSGLRGMRRRARARGPGEAQGREAGTLPRRRPSPHCGQPGSADPQVSLSQSRMRLATRSPSSRGRSWPALGCIASGAFHRAAIERAAPADTFPSRP